MLFRTIFLAFSVFRKLSKYCSKIENLIVVLLSYAVKSELNIESSYGHYQSQNGNDMQNWVVFTSFLATVFVKHGKF